MYQRRGLPLCRKIAGAASGDGWWVVSSFPWSKGLLECCLERAFCWCLCALKSVGLIVMIVFCPHSIDEIIDALAHVRPVLGPWFHAKFHT